MDPRFGAARRAAGAVPDGVPAVGPRARAEGARLVVGRLVALPVAARRPGATAPAELGRHCAGDRAGAVPQLHRLRRRPAQPAADAGRDRYLHDRDPDRRDQPPDQRAGHHGVDGLARAAVPRHRRHDRRRVARLVALRAGRSHPGCRDGRVVDVLLGEHVVSGAAAGVRGARGGGVGPRSAGRRADPAAVRGRPARPGDRPDGRAAVRAAGRELGVPGVGGDRRRARARAGAF